MTPHHALPAVGAVPVAPAPGGPIPGGSTPVVLGGVLRSDSPFLDVLPMDTVPLDTLAPADGLLFLPLQPVSPEPLGAAASEPALPTAPFDRAAVERARVRATHAVERVEATVMSDDGLAEHVCDVSAWLAAATARELDALAQAGWTGDEAAEVADALAEDDPEVADVVRHARRTDAAVVVEIDGRAAMAWLARHRPAVVDALDDRSADEATDEG